METVRVRLLFEDRHILSKPQRKEGLARCWVLLRPELDTVAALASHIVHSFGLQDSCPRGVVLSMDCFVLPPFEATDIFKDKDIIRLRKRGGMLTEAIKLTHDKYHIEAPEIIDKQPLHLCDNLVVAEEFEKESGGYQSKDEENEGDQPMEAICPETPLDRKTSLKRKKDSNKHLNLKRQKTKLAKPDECPTVSLEAAENIHVECEDHSQEDGIKQGSSSMKNRSINKAHQPSMGHITEQRHLEAEESCQRNAAELNVISCNKKTPGRSARRKKAKREWLREVKKLEKELIQSDILESGTQEKPKLHHTCDQDDDIDEVVPVVVKPGHIRFEPLGESEPPSYKPVETLKWNGTVSKKKGQKWGREKNFSCGVNNYNRPIQQPNAVSVVEEYEKEDQLTEFEKLFPLTRKPEEGDVVTYRVVELSSSWCPELSSFRVGKVMSYDPTSMKIILVQVPEFPVSVGGGDEEGSGLHPDNSLYKEDGSLEIDFQSLHDVRLFNDDKAIMNASSSVKETMDTVPVVGTQKPGTAVRTNHKADGVVAQPTDSKGRGGWEEICRALDDKKAELSQKDSWASWDRKQTTTSTSWSYRALRRSALGPTVSLLRSQNNI